MLFNYIYNDATYSIFIARMHLSRDVFVRPVLMTLARVIWGICCINVYYHKEPHNNKKTCDEKRCDHKKKTKVPKAENKRVHHRENLSGNMFYAVCLCGALCVLVL